MINAGEVAADIGLEHMTNLLCHDMQAKSLQGVMRVAPWSKAVTAIEEIDFKYSLENARDRPLQQPVSDSGDAAGIVHLMQLVLGMIYEDGLR